MKSGMKETVILAPHCKQRELLRTLARFGKELFGVRVMDAGELSKSLLLRSGVSYGKLISLKEETYLYDSFLRDIPYFRLSSFQDSRHIAVSFHQLRSLILQDEEKTIIEKLKEGVFLEKNEALTEVYERYNSLKKEAGVLDEIDLIRLAVEKAEKREDISFKCIKEYPLTPLEEVLLKKVSGDLEEISLSDLYPKGEEREFSYHQAYDISDEIREVLEDIYQKNIPLMSV